MLFSLWMPACPDLAGPAAPRCPGLGAVEQGLPDGGPREARNYGRFKGLAANRREAGLDPPSGSAATAGWWIGRWRVKTRPTRDPGVDMALEHLQRHRAGFQDGIVEGPQVELGT